MMRRLLTSSVSMSFVDLISCGFCAMILLVMTVLSSQERGEGSSSAFAQITFEVTYPSTPQGLHEVIRINQLDRLSITGPGVILDQKLKVEEKKAFETPFYWALTGKSEDPQMTFTNLPSPILREAGFQWSRTVMVDYRETLLPQEIEWHFFSDSKPRPTAVTLRVVAGDQSQDLARVIRFTKKNQSGSIRVVVGRDVSAKVQGEMP